MTRASCFILFALTVAGRVPAARADNAIEFFEKKIRPVLVARCYKCHSAEAEKVGGKLLLDSREAWRQGGESGAAILPGDAGKSLLMEALRYESLEMPPDGKLSDQQIADFDKWIQDGAVDPRNSGGPDHQVLDDDEIDFAAGRQFWSFRVPVEAALPEISNPTWPQNRIDHFVLAKLDQHELAPSRRAEPRTLIRRLSFDLTGLPPTPDEVRDFTSAFSKDPETAVANQVRNLLASPRYGEHWARMWLDVARYAEDQAHIVGNNKSLFYPHAYLYRDWVIAALNDDVPFDDFVKYQLADDLLHPDDPTHRAALGFIGLGPKYYRRGDLEVMADEWEDRVDTVSRGLLGLTVACARCHDHKYDPISTEDYYALAGIFASTELVNQPLPKNAAESQDKDAVLHVVRDKNVRNLNVFVRGDVKVPGALVERRFLQVLCDGPPPIYSSGSGRQELAEAIVSPDNPLTARVIVNRVWGRLLGRPLVKTPSNFGALGQKPSHPALLDDLAARFMENGWSLKWLMREIVLSSTYQQDSLGAAKSRDSDPANIWLSRMNRKRLDVEAWRDSLLFVTGTLSSRIGGKSIDIQDTAQSRRTIYSAVSRFELDAMLSMFDFPDPNVHSARRVQTTTPLQKLFVMNSPFMIEQAKRLAQNSFGGPPTSADLEHVYLKLFARHPEQVERQWATAFLGEQPTREQWTQYAHVLLASNEFLYVD